MDPGDPALKVNWEKRRDLHADHWHDKTVTEYWRDAIAAVPNKTAVVEIHPDPDRLPEVKRRDQDSLTYDELDAHANQIAHGLTERGVEPGDCVAMQLPNWWQWHAVALAVDRLGAVLVPILDSHRGTEVEHIVDDTSATALVVPAQYRGFDYPAMVADVWPDLDSLETVFVLGDDPEGMVDLHTHSAAVASERSEDDLPDVDPDPDDVAKILYTSGTTGKPKGVLHTHNTACITPELISEIFEWDDTGVFHVSSPMSHKSGTWFAFLLPLIRQGTSVVQDIWDPDAFVRAIEAEDITATIGATPFLKDTVDSELMDSADVSSLSEFLCGGAPVPRVLVQEAREVLACNVVSVWGMTENGVPVATRPDDPIEKIIETDGYSVRGTEIKILDEDGNEVVGEEGDLFSRDPQMCVGYLNRPDANAETFDEDCWLATGDRAIMDEDGYIDIVGRSKDIINRGGENINPAPIEDLLLEHPHVEDVAIVGMPDERLGERACAFVQPTAGEEVTLADVRDFLDEKQIDKHKYPERVELVDEFPKTTTGKTQKFKLRENISERV